jgi:hypothetical protein
MPTFAYTWSTGTLTQSDGTVSAAIPLEGTVEGFGTVFGTLHSHNVGKPSGTWEFIGVSFPESGEQVTGLGSDLSTGQTVKSEGVFSLTERTWSGTFH